MTKTHYQIEQGLKHSELDIFREGCQPSTSKTFTVKNLIKANTLDELIISLMKEYGVSDKANIMINACDELGRIDVQTYEDENCNSASALQLIRWEKGEFNLYLCTYSFYVSRITTESDFDLSTLVTDLKDYTTC